MAKRQIFYSFHFDNDVFRVQQIRNMGALEENKPVSANQWEEVKRGGDAAIKRWIDDNMKGRSCVVVLVGEETAKRKWVKYEIEKAWEDGKGVLGIYVHNIHCMVNGTCSKGPNPFEQFSNLFGKIKCYDPGRDAYNTIKKNIENWVEDAIKIRNNI
jgi:hypothetical protein